MRVWLGGGIKGCMYVLARLNSVGRSSAQGAFSARDAPRRLVVLYSVWIYVHGFTAAPGHHFALNFRSLRG